MNLKRVLKNKRGIALENAILFMLLIFVLCALLISMALIGNYQVKIENMTLLRDVQIEQIGEDYLSHVAAEESFDELYEDYAYSVKGNALTVWRSTDNTKTAVLYVEAELADGELNVICWRYSLPAQTE